MKARLGTDKGNRGVFSGIYLSLLLLLLVLGCASGPSEPGDENHAPFFQDLTLNGNKPVIAAGAKDLILKAEVYDDDPEDVLELTWSGPGTFHDKNDEQQTVLWDVPAEDYGILEITCTASDGKDSDSRSRSFAVGRNLGGDDIGSIQGDQVRWTVKEAGDPPFYVMTGDVLVPPTYRLYIGARSSIYVEQGTRLTVQNDLEIAGDSGNDQIIFRPYGEPGESNLDWWDGIDFESSTGTLLVQRAIIRRATNGISIPLGAPQGGTLSYVLFENCRKGLNANSTPLLIEGVYAQGGDTGFDLEGCEVEINGCNFALLPTLGISLSGQCEGTCTGSFFDGQSVKSIAMTGNSQVSFNQNRFLGTNTVLGCSGYDPGSSLDFTCNYWGENQNLADIQARIVHDTADPQVNVFPFQSVPNQPCP